MSVYLDADGKPHSFELNECEVHELHYPWAGPAIAKTPDGAWLHGKPMSGIKGADLNAPQWARIRYHWAEVGAGGAVTHFNKEGLDLPPSLIADIARQDWNGPPVTQAVLSLLQQTLFAINRATLGKDLIKFLHSRPNQTATPVDAYKHVHNTLKTPTRDDMKTFRQFVNRTARSLTNARTPFRLEASWNKRYVKLADVSPKQDGRQDVAK